MTVIKYGLGPSPGPLTHFLEVELIVEEPDETDLEYSHREAKYQAQMRGMKVKAYQINNGEITPMLVV